MGLDGAEEGRPACPIANDTPPGGENPHPSPDDASHRPGAGLSRKRERRRKTRAFSARVSQVQTGLAAQAAGGV